MPRILIIIALIFVLGFTPTTTSCGGPTGLIILGVVIIIGVILLTEDIPAPTVMGGSSIESMYPPADFELLTRTPGSNILKCSIDSRSDVDWYKTATLYEGDVLTVRSESQGGIKVLVFDETGKDYVSDNTEPGTDFRIEMHAMQETSLFLLVYNEYMAEPADYELLWHYGR